MKLWLKALISLALMAFLVSQINLKELYDVFRTTNLKLWLLAFGVFLFQQGIVAYCWHILLSVDNKVPFVKTLEVHFIGSFFGTFLPSSVGMDVIRIYRLGRYLEKGVDAASTMFVTRVVGFLINFLMALIVAIPISNSLNDSRIFWTVLILTFLFVTGVTLALYGRSIDFLKRCLLRLGLSMVAEKIDGFRNKIVQLVWSYAITAKLVVLSIVYQIIGIIIIYIIGQALAIDIGIWHYFIYIPLITTITILPISLAGIGVREEAFIFFFAFAGMTNTQALSLSLMVFAQSLALAALGGIWYLAVKENQNVSPPIHKRAI